MPRAACALLTVAFASLATATARADDDPPITIAITGSAAPGFATKSEEATRPRDVPDAAALFDGLPGLRVRRLAGESSFATLSIRGAASNQVGVSLAGVPLTGAADPSLDFSSLPLWPGASARVYRTFAPAALGGGYLGGLVEISPVDVTSDRAHTETYGAIASFASLRLRIADVRPLGDGDERWRVATGVSASRTDGDFLYWDPNTSMDVRRRNAASAQVGAVLQARRDAGPWTVLLTGLASARRDGVAGPFDHPTYFTRLSRDRQLAAIEARRADDDGRWLARVWARREGRTFDDPRAEQSYLGGTSFDRVLAVGSTLGRSFHPGDWVFDARLDEAVESSDGERVAAAAPRRDRFRLGAALDATFRASEWLTLVGAARGDLRADRGSAETRLVDRGQEGDDRELLPAAHVGFECGPFAGATIAGHVGALSRPPSFLELLGDGGAYTPSPGLKSEHAFAGDLGVRFARGRVPRFVAELVGFASETHDLIVTVPIGLRSLRAVNVGDARVLGAEASLAMELGPVRTIASYTHLATEDRTSDAASAGQALPGRPRHDLTLDVTWKIGRLSLRYGFDLVSSTTLDREGTRELPTRMFHGVGARYALGPVTLVGQIDNVFDQRTVDVVGESGAAAIRYPTSDFLGYPLPGRRFTLAVRSAL